MNVHSNAGNFAGRKFSERGTLIYTQDEVPLSSSEWQQLHNLLADLHYDHVVSGDASVGSRHFHPDARTLMVNNCTIPHEVEPVIAGERFTLACFLSPEFGSSRTARKGFKIVA